MLKDFLEPFLGSLLTNPYFIFSIKVLARLAVFAMPFVLALMAWKSWVHYINRLFLVNMNWVLLEIRIPKEVWKTPLAMEIFLINALYQTGGTGTWVHKWWKGNLRNWFSLEIVSIEGNIFFFIRSPKAFKNIIEAQLYAQYPQAEINEVNDYTSEVSELTKGGDWGMWGCEFTTTKADPYPIKTYVDYGLDKATGLEEEQKIDPITPLMEFLGSVGKGQQVWMQILVRATADRFPVPGTWFEKRNWIAEGRDEIKKIADKYTITNDKGAKIIAIPKIEQDTINAIDRNISKLGFDCGIRAIYIANEGSFNAVNITGMVGTFKQYNSVNLNGFRPANSTDFDYPWQDFSGKKTFKKKKDMFDEYRLRSFFYHPSNKKPFTLSSEELATIFHFPGRVSETPSFKRIEFKKSEPPANLPF